MKLLNTLKNLLLLNNPVEVETLDDLVDEKALQDHLEYMRKNYPHFYDEEMEEFLIK